MARLAAESDLLHVDLKRTERIFMIPFSKWLRTSRHALAPIFIASVLASCATTPPSPAEPEKLVSDAQVTLSNFLRDPDQTWIQENLNRARAVLIAPQIVKAGFIFGGSGGRAVLVARDGRTWAGPAFYDLATASVGFQAGVEVSEAVIVVMTDKGLNSLLSSTFKVGGDASIAAGPVGAGAKSTVTADLISFTRAKGVYGGVNLDGTVVHSNVPWNDAYYGRSNVLPPDILIRKTATSPKAKVLLTQVAEATK
jgi:SH3 domain-containing YSC84-like protein 1